MSEVNQLPAKPTKRWSCTGCLLVAGGVFAVVVALVALAIGIYFNSLQREGRRLLAEEISRVRAGGEPLGGEELNAWHVVPPGEEDITDVYVTALAALDLTQFESDAADLPYVGNVSDTPPIPPEDWPQLEQAERFLEQHQAMLDGLHQGAQLKGSVRYPMDWRETAEPKFVYTHANLHAARLLQLEALCRLHRGDVIGSADSITTIIRASETLRREPCFISQIVRVANQDRAIAGLQSLILGADVPEEMLQRLQEEFSSTSFESGALTAAVGERAIVYEIMHGSIQELDERFEVEAPSTARRRKAVIVAHPEHCAQALRIINDYVDALKKPLPATIKEVEHVFAESNSIKEANRNRNKWERAYLASLLLISFEMNSALNGTVRAEAMRRCAVAMLAAERFRRREGRLPESLDELVPEFLEAMPDDPCTGSSLLYAVSESGYTIYSVGTDETDNGGDIDATDFGIRIDSLRPLEGAHN